MTSEVLRTLCWTPLWNQSYQGAGLEHLMLCEGTADSVVLGVDETGTPFRLSYRLHWNAEWHLHSADLDVVMAGAVRSRSFRADGQGRWEDSEGRTLPHLDGCMDIDIWPTPFTNSFPIRRCVMDIGERREFRMAWVFGPELTVQPQQQAYTRLADRLYLFESLDNSGFKAELSVDEDGIVLDYPGLFRRVMTRK